MNRHLAAWFALAVLSAGSWSHPAQAQSLQCQASATGTSGGPVPLTVFFKALTAGGNPPLAYRWDFGDGVTSNQQNPIHQYTEVGTYHAVLRVTPNGVPAAACRDTLRVQVATFVDPLCWAAANTRWAESANAIRFSAGPALLPDPPPYRWTWNFGDGSIQTLESSSFMFVDHAYAVPGTYWAAVSLQTPLATYNCWPTQRVTTLVPQIQVDVEPESGVPALHLEPPRPNPFGIATTLGYALPREGRVRLVIVDPLGRRVATLADGIRPAGRHIAVWQGRADAGHVVRTGVYVAVLEQDGESRSVRIVRAR